MGDKDRTAQIGVKSLTIPFFFAIIGILLAIGVLTCGCTSQEEKTPLRVVAAGSLILPLQEIEPYFEEKYPGVDLLVEGHGSIQAVRQVTDLNRPFDLVAVADASLIPLMMYQPMPDGTANWTDSMIPFGRNEIVLAYTDKSRYADQVSAINWKDILKKDDVRFGLANPVLDAAGYRALMVLALADRYYDEDILGPVLTDHFQGTVHVTKTTNETLITLPDVMKPSDEKVSIRDGSIFLLSLLETGGIDYALEYRSVAEGADLPYIRLPESINLVDPDSEPYYQAVTIDLNFKRFSSIDISRTGGPIIYGLAIPANAEHPEEAELLIRELTGDTSNIRGMPDPLNKGEL